MEIYKLMAFFKWCTVINVGLFLVSALMLIAVPDFIYGVHGQFFNMPREAFDVAIYTMLGMYKIIILTFSLGPYLAMLIVGKNDSPAHTGAA